MRNSLQPGLAESGVGGPREVNMKAAVLGSAGIEICDQEKPAPKPFTRFSAYAFLLGGYAVSLGIGLLIGWHAEDFFSDLTLLFRHVPSIGGAGSASTTALLISDLLLYPPIAVLIVDTMHGLASRIDAG